MRKGSMTEGQEDLTCYEYTPQRNACGIQNLTK
jgi:hypothetical protein